MMWEVINKMVIGGSLKRNGNDYRTWNLHSRFLRGVDDKWKGIGVRIEDDILVTDSGFEILTPDVPRTIEEVEQTVQG